MIHMSLHSISRFAEEEELAHHDDNEDCSEHRTIKICKLINELGMTPKSFLQNLLDSEEPSVVKRRQFFGSSTGWPSTLRVIETLKSLVFKNRKTVNIENWNAFILKEVRLHTHKWSFSWNECSDNVEYGLINGFDMI